MTILYLADIRFPLERANGIQTMETCWALAARGHRVVLVVRPDSQTPARDPFEYYGLPLIDGLTIVRAPVPPGVPQLARRAGYMAFALGQVLAARRDIILTRDLAVASMLLRVPHGARLVYESHGYAPQVAAALPTLVSTAHPPSARKIARLTRRESRVWRGADGYVTITAGLADELRARFGPRDRVAVIHDGVRTIDSAVSRDDQSSATSDAHRPVVVYAGHLYPWKGVDVLLHALAQTPEVDAVIVGGHEKEPDLARVRALAASLGIGERVRFTGMIRPPEVAAKLSSADVLALPNPASAISTHATSPLKLFEYMAAGRAIVASDLPSIREVLSNDVNALLVAPGDAAALSAAMRRLAADPALRTRLGSAARTAVADYSWSRRAERLERLFAEACAGPR